MPNPAFWGQLGPQNKLIEGQPNVYDVICRNALVLEFHLWPTIFTGAPFRLQNICQNGVPPRSRTTAPLASHTKLFSVAQSYYLLLCVCVCVYGTDTCRADVSSSACCLSRASRLQSARVVSSSALSCEMTASRSASSTRTCSASSRLRDARCFCILYAVGGVA